MSEPYESLEAELAALQPQKPSAELAKRISRRLEADLPAPMAGPRMNGTRSLPATHSRRWLGLALAGALVAAGVVAAVVLWRGDHRVPQAESPIDPPELMLASTLDSSLPSVWTYRQALKSPDALDALLDKHARLTPSTGDPLVQTRGFGPLTTNLESRLGGL